MTAGGVDVKEVHCPEYASKLVAGLSWPGGSDVDGYTGGNLQACLFHRLLAGKNAALRKFKRPMQKPESFMLKISSVSASLGHGTSGEEIFICPNQSLMKPYRCQ